MIDDELGRIKAELYNVRAQIIKKSTIKRVASIEREAVERDAIGICEMAAEIIAIIRKANGDLDTKTLVDEVHKCLRTKPTSLTE